MPTRPNKDTDKPNDELGYDGRAVEVDALAMNMARDAIESHLDTALYEETLSRRERDIALRRKLVAKHRRRY